MTSMARLTPFSLQSKSEVTWLMFLGKKMFKTDLTLTSVILLLFLGTSSFRLVPKPSLIRPCIDKA